MAIFFFYKITLTKVMWKYVNVAFIILLSMFLLGETRGVRCDLLQICQLKFYCSIISTTVLHFEKRSRDKSRDKAG